MNRLQCVLILITYFNMLKNIYVINFYISIYLWRKLYLYDYSVLAIIRFVKKKKRVHAVHEMHTSLALSRIDIGVFEIVIQKSPEISRLPVDASSGAAAPQRPVNGKQTRGFWHGGRGRSDWQTSVSTRNWREKFSISRCTRGTSRNVARRPPRQHDDAPAVLRGRVRGRKKTRETEINYFRRQRQIRSWRDDRSPAWYD